LLFLTGLASTFAAPPDELAQDAAGLVELYYVFPDKGANAAALLRERLAAGVYKGIEDPAALAAALTADLQSVTKDRHMRVRPPAKEPGANPRPAAGPAVARAEILPGNVGYLDLRVFPPLSAARDELAGAMTRVAGADALIIDVRGHRGGSPDTVAFVTSYLLEPEPVHLNTIHGRADSRREFWTFREVPGRRYGGAKPVMVLTSGFTFSAGEEFAYNLQSLGRAILIGETTGGGAHPGQTHELPGGFRLFVPHSRSVNPRTGSNWEGTGVQPKVPAPARDAFAVAYRSLLEGKSLGAAEGAARDELLQNPPGPASFERPR
jgi:hypothetical protein